MNQKMESFARQQLKQGLAQLSEAHHKLFKQMYSYKHPDRSIDEIIDNMPADKLDHAMSQVERSLQKISKAAKP